MSLAEGLSTYLVRKFYATGDIAVAEPAPATDPGAAGGQIMRRTTFTPTKQRATHSPNEVNKSRQRKSMRLGGVSVSGALTGDLSPGTYWDDFVAALRATASSAVVASSEADFTSVSGENAASTFTFSGGDPVTKGYRVGDIMRFTGLSVSANNSINYVVTGFSGTSNRVVAVYPSPTDMAADSVFALSSVGRSVYAPASGHVKHKVAFEVVREDTDSSKLFTEGRYGGFKVNLPGDGVSTVEFPLSFRNMARYAGASSPFFTAPTAESATPVIDALDGLLLINGTAATHVTGIEINAPANITTPKPSLGSTLPGDIFVGELTISGQMSVYVSDDTTLSDAFDNETEVSLLVYAKASSDAIAHAMTIFLPALKLVSDDDPVQGVAEQTKTVRFEAYQYGGSSPGVESTGIRLTDTAAA